MKPVLLLISLIISALTYGQKYYDIDLSKKTQNEPTIELNYKGVRLKNKLPFKDYVVKIEVEQEPNTAADKGLSGISECIEKNADYKKARQAFRDEKDEANIPGKLAALKAATVSDDCKEDLKKDYAEQEAATIEEVDFTFDLKKNQNIIVTITKPSGNKVTVVLRTPRQVNYITHFGMSFIPGGEKNSENFYAKQDTGTTYLVTPMNKNGDDFWKDVSITANFLVFPFKYKNADADIKVAVAGGFGISGDTRFSVFIGPSLVFKDFLSFTVAGGLYHKSRLKGQYSSGQRVTENLDFDQLHEKGLRPALTLSIGFRLSKEQVQEGVKVIGGNTTSN